MRHQTLGSIRTLLHRDDVVKKGIRRAMRQDANWVLGELPRYLEPIRGLRNPAAHGEDIDRERLAQRRCELLGIGCEGLVVQVVRVKLRSG